MQRQELIDIAVRIVFPFELEHGVKRIVKELVSVDPDYGRIHFTISDLEKFATEIRKAALNKVIDSLQYDISTLEQTQLTDYGKGCLSQAKKTAGFVLMEIENRVGE